MGIQINGNTNNINAGIGSLSIEDINELDIIGVATASNFKTGTSNLHSTGLNIFDLDVDGQTNLDHTSIVGIVTISAGTNNEGLRITGQHNNCVIFTSPSINSSAGYRLNHHPSTNFLRIDTTDQNGAYTGIVAKFSSAGLDMADNIKLRLGTSQDLTLYHYGNNAYIDNATGSILFRQGGSEKVRITSTGQLKINGNDDQDNLSVTINNNTEFAVHQDDTDGEVSLRAQDPSGSNNPKYMTFFTHPSGSAAAERLRITSTGQFVVGSNPTVNSGNIVHIEAPTSFNSGETIVNIEGNNAAAAARIVLHNNNTGGSAYNEILGADAGGQSTSSIRFYNTDQSNNYGEIAFGTRNQSGVPPVDRMRISKEGYVNKPYHPAFCATRSGASNIQLHQNSNIDVDFPTKDFDNSNSFNTSNGRFTAPIAGKYYFGVQFYCGFSVTSVRVMHASWRKNGSLSHEADLFGGIGNFGNSSMNHYHPTTNAHVMLELAAGDYVTFNTGTNSFIGSGNTYLYGSKGSRFFGYLVA